MQKPELEDGFTKLSNELLDAICKLRIPGEARQVFDAILRKTYGYNKKSDAISLSQFCELTGLKKANVFRSIKKLEDMNLIKIDKSNYVSIYSINKYYETWKLVSKAIPLTDNKTGIKSDTETGIISEQTGIKSDAETGIKSDTHKRKKDNTKERKREREENPSQKNENLGSIWRAVFLKNPGVVELEFLEELVSIFSMEKAKKILRDLRERNFRSLHSMKRSLNPDGTIKPFEEVHGNNRRNSTQVITEDEIREYSESILNDDRFK